MGVSSPSASFPLKCLLWQYDELMRKPLEGVNAAPLEDNIFEWHGNFYFAEDHRSFPGMVVHFLLELPKDFPNSTPNMKLHTTFQHSHVFGGSICFSLLKDFEWHFQGYEETVFWNPSRTIRSLLESVYVFLTVDEDAHPRWKGSTSTRKSAISAAQTTPCGRCGHNPASGNVWPPEEHWLAARTCSATCGNPSAEQQVCALAMHQDLTTADDDRKQPPRPAQPAPLLKPSDYRSRYGVTSITATTRITVTASHRLIGPNPSSFEHSSAVMKAEANEMVAIAQQQASPLDTEALEDFRCSISGIAFDHSDKVVLGFGVNVVRRDRDRSIESITTDLTPISMEIFFKGKIRKSALGAKMTHFFPFAINEQHWQRAKRVLPGCVGAILRDGPEDASVTTAEDRLLFVVGELWKSMAVLMMKGGTHASEKVLKGFCSLHHLLLLAAELPDTVIDRKPMVKAATAAAAAAASVSKVEGDNNEEGKGWSMVIHRQKKINNQNGTGDSVLLSMANERVQRFARNPRMRHKAQCPDFGRFLPLILLSNMHWRDFQEPLIGELLARNARWICKADRGLGTVTPTERTSPSDRAQRSWAASSTGLKLTAFQIRFALSVLPWAQEALPAAVVAAYQSANHSHLLLVRLMYNVLGGRPTQDMLRRFQKETKAIEAVGSFSEIFQMIDLPRDEMAIQIMLCDAMEQSKRFGYHRA
ncbi:hypothetical protein ACA910_008925 [Epithemia clementina (nom. ined.)]